MADEFHLYTVTSRREPFYAIVEPSTGRVWTAPTKDGAIRQAREAGITQFTERTITRDQFLQSLGISDQPAQRTFHEPAAVQPEPAAPKPGSPDAWFVAGAGGLDADSLSNDFTIPRSFTTGKNRMKPAKGGAMFAGGLIPSPIRMEIVADDEDILIVPSQQRAVTKSSPFTDTPAPMQTGDPTE